MAFLYYFKIILISLHLSITHKLCSCKQLRFSLPSIVVCNSGIDHLVLHEVVSAELMSNDNEIQAVYIYMWGLVRFNEM